MPNIDAGHYFLTVLLPIRRDPVEIYDHVVTTPMLAVREWLAGLPTAHQSPVCVSAGNSPFARNLRNHFARFSVIDVPAFNGRVQTDAVVMALRKINPIVPQPVDQLNTPYLFFSADFNCIHGDDRDLESYLATLWATMEPEIRKIFQYCYGFETVESAATFTAFIKRGQVETTMPFHDYWIDTPKLPTLPLPLMGAAALIGGLALLVGFVALVAHGHVLVWLLLTLIGAGIFFGLYKFVMARGVQPFPAAHGADLPGVLKSLYLQKQFTRFAIDNQGADPAALHAAFAAFLQTHQPDHVASPTQAPGVIGA
ncbi:hypothetical protein [Methyloferula stellata]|uniref:hypothetical protein n=1 Tax=Methyloferula stellata TaxID=876270 RepID=UPI0003747EF4|nr:hypothetical protein [Methyloferula stellata]